MQDKIDEDILPQGSYFIFSLQNKNLFTQI